MFSSVGYETHFTKGIFTFCINICVPTLVVLCFHKFFASMSDMKPDVWKELPHSIVDELRAAAFGLAFATVVTLGLAPVLYATLLRIPSPRS